MFHSQGSQDKYLEQNVFKGFKNGFFVDVGAYDGIHINNTLYFEETNQWTGINVEPNKRIFSEINAYISGDIEPGLLIVEGKLMPGISMEQADESIWIALDEMKTDLVPVREMQKNINKLVSAFVFGEMSLLNKVLLID